ncbi:MAG: hypothetical protein C5B58_10200 [Acidobacteria bacterium]|nr:MAG: hypothetical protein C5B58_10200 [Acidobacteriota bacterium]
MVRPAKTCPRVTEVDCVFANGPFAVGAIGRDPHSTIIVHQKITQNLRPSVNLVAPSGVRMFDLDPVLRLPGPVGSFPPSLIPCVAPRRRVCAPQSARKSDRFRWRPAFAIRAARNDSANGDCRPGLTLRNAQRVGASDR